MGFWSAKLATSETGDGKRQSFRIVQLDNRRIEQLSHQGCSACTLDKERRLSHPKMKATGARDPDVYFIGEAPGGDEDDKGVQFVGKSGNLIRRAIPSEWDDRIRWDNVIDCRPPGNRDPTPLEVACCRGRQVADIERSKPKLIVAVGAVALRWFTGLDTISFWRGRFMPVRVGTHTCWMTPVFHPSFVLRSRHASGGTETEHVFKFDIDRALSVVDSLPEPFVEDAETMDDGIVLITKIPEARAALKEVATWETFSFDIETNGLRPYDKDPKLLTVSFSNYERTFSIAINHPEARRSREEHAELISILSDFFLKNGRRVAIAHNSTFEQEWLLFWLGPKIVFNVMWHDTMAQAYVLDERKKTKNLGDCTLTRLGLNIKQFSNLDRARLAFAPLDRVLRYNAYDAKFTYLLYYVQRELLQEERLLSVYESCNARSGPIVIAQSLGLLPDFDAVDKLMEEYRKLVVADQAAIQRLPDVRKFVAKYGRFSSASNPDLVELFYRFLGFKECEVFDNKSKKTKLQTDEAVLSRIDHEAARLILSLRNNTRMFSTYLKPISRTGKEVWSDGLIHTNFNHLLTTTTRLSSDHPNVQNLPIRDEISKRIRTAFRAPDESAFVSLDFGQIEARVIAMASGDKFLVNALWDGYDIHMEYAEKLARAYPSRIGGRRFLTDKGVMKAFRADVKNQWTFPLFFGSAMESVAEALNIPQSKVGPLYDEFWDTFSGVHEWQEALRRDYRRLGYVAKLTGGRRHAPMSINEMINSPIQGTAADIVNDAFVRLSHRAYKENKPYLQWRLQIHDDLSFYVPEAVLDDAIPEIAREMVRVDVFDFINVPLTVEVSVGTNWYDKEEIGKYSSTDFGHRRDAKSV